MQVVGVFDIDGTITDLNFLGLKNADKIIDLNNKMINNKSLRSLLYIFILIICKKYKLRNNVKEIISYFKDCNININFLTKRLFTTENSLEGQMIRKLTYEMLINEDIPFDRVIFTKGSKVKDCLDLKADFVVEDSPQNIIELSKYLPVIVIDTPYNKNIEGHNIYRVNDLLELKDLINKLFINNKVK